MKVHPESQHSEGCHWDRGHGGYGERATGAIEGPFDVTGVGRRIQDERQREETGECKARCTTSAWVAMVVRNQQPFTVVNRVVWQHESRW